MYFELVMLVMAKRDVDLAQRNLLDVKGYNCRRRSSRSVSEPVKCRN